jgi:trk system potassium uptake protein TrkH
MSFSLLPGAFEPFRAGPVVNCIVMALALLGAVGFLVVLDLWQLARGKAKGLAFSSTVILRIFPLLILDGTLALAFAEPVIAAIPARGRAMAALFQSINAATTKDFNSVPIAEIAPAGPSC